MPASSSAVPVAERRFRLKMAFSTVGVGATGGTFSTALCSSGTGICGAYQAFNWFFTAGNPQQKTKAVRKIQGSHAFQAGPVATGETTAPAALVCAADAPSLTDSS